MSQLWVVDASALLATIKAEPGSNFVEERITDCCVSSINWAEVLQKMERNGMDAPLVESMLLALGFYKSLTLLPLIRVLRHHFGK